MSTSTKTLEDRAPRSLSLDVPTFMIAAGFLLAGFAYGDATEPSPAFVRGIDQHVQTILPPGFDVVDQANSLTISYADPQDGAPQDHAVLRVTRMENGNGPPVQLDHLRARRAALGVGYQELEREETRSFGGHRAEWSHFVVVILDRTDRGPVDVPMVVVGADVLVHTDQGPYHVELEVRRVSAMWSVLNPMLNALTIR